MSSSSSVKPVLTFSEINGPQFVDLESSWPATATAAAAGSFCKHAKIYHFSSEIILEQLLYIFGDFFWSHSLDANDFLQMTLIEIA